MSEQIAQLLIFCSSGVLVSLIALFFGSMNNNSNFESLVEAWKEKRLAELKVKQLEAEHVLKCPRLTDTPRK